MYTETAFLQLLLHLLDCWMKIQRLFCYGILQANQLQVLHGEILVGTVQLTYSSAPRVHFQMREISEDLLAQYGTLDKIPESDWVFAADSSFSTINLYAALKVVSRSYAPTDVG